MQPDVSIIIPTFNERENLPVLVGRIVRVLDGLAGTYELILFYHHNPD